MKKLPTPPTMPKRILNVWPMIALPLEASAPAPGRLWVAAAPGVVGVEVSAADPGSFVKSK